MKVSNGYLCHHHNYDLKAMVEDWESCVDKFAHNFPKNHHPACDRKSQNDCDCPDFTRGAHAMMTLKAVVGQSRLYSPLYIEYIKLTMADKVKRIGKYYAKATEEDIYLPPNSKFRQFRFFTWNKKKQRIVVRIIKDNISSKKVLLKHLRKLKPLQVFYTTGLWLNPQGIGPNPEGKFGRSKFVKKKWCDKDGNVTLPRYHNTLMKRDLFFDVDYDNKDYNEGIRMVQRTIDTLLKLRKTGKYTLPRLTEDDIEIVFSGGKGFHVIVHGYYDKVLVGDEPLTEFVNTTMKNEMVESFYKDLVSEFQALDPDLLLDWMVTYDNRRIIRLPGTVHYKTMRVCSRLTGVNDNRIIKNDKGHFSEYNADCPV